MATNGTLVVTLLNSEIVEYRLVEQEDAHKTAEAFARDGVWIDETFYPAHAILSIKVSVERPALMYINGSVHEV